MADPSEAPQLKAAGFDAVLSGHTHQARHDVSTNGMPIHQFVGGGPKPEAATLMVIDASMEDDQPTAQIRIIDLQGNTLFETHLGSAG